MNDTEIEKINRFLNDKIMSDAVRDVLTKAFLKPVPHADVNILAASRIALDLLDNAWKELNNYKKETPIKNDTKSQLGM